MRGSLAAQDFNLSSVGTACIILISKASLCLSLMWSVWTAYKNLESLWWTVYLIHITKAYLEKNQIAQICDPSFLTTGRRIKALNVIYEFFAWHSLGKRIFTFYLNFWNTLGQFWQVDLFCISNYQVIQIEPEVSLSSTVHRDLSENSVTKYSAINSQKSQAASNGAASWRTPNGIKKSQSVGDVHT